MTLTDQICKLLPVGDAWIKAASTNLYKTVGLFSAAYQRVLDFGDYAKQDSFPLSAQDSIVDWQKSCNLPDPLCPVLTDAQQRLQMIARVENLGGQSPAYYISEAAKIGYTITIQELAVARAGLSSVGLSATYGAYADFTWVITTNEELSYFRAGINRAGDPLSSGPSIAWLQYEIHRISPAYSKIWWV